MLLSERWTKALGECKRFVTSYTGAPTPAGLTYMTNETTQVSE